MIEIDTSNEDHFWLICQRCGKTMGWEHIYSSGNGRFGRRLACKDGAEAIHKGTFTDKLFVPPPGYSFEDTSTPEVSVKLATCTCGSCGKNADVGVKCWWCGSKN
jgi:hypothetical protein